MNSCQKVGKNSIWNLRRQEGLKEQSVQQEKEKNQKLNKARRDLPKVIVLASSEYGLGEHQSHSLGVFRVWLWGSKVAIFQGLGSKDFFLKPQKELGDLQNNRVQGLGFQGLGLIHTYTLKIVEGALHRVAVPPRPPSSLLKGAQKLF